MQRRSVLALALAALLPLGAAAEPLSYTPGLVEQRLSAGETVFLDFKASWCTTCAAQARVLAALKAENPAYEQAITFIDIDWDTYSDDEITRALDIPRRSTLVVLRGDEELGRVVAQTSRDAIKSLMDLALASAGS